MTGNECKQVQTGNQSMNQNIRITNPNSTLMDIVCLLSDGNPGAVRVMAEIARSITTIDPDDCLGAFGPLLQLDTIGIYGSDIWILFKDLCGESIVNTIGILRAEQLGLVSDRTVLNAIADCKRGIGSSFRGEVLTILAKVMKRLPNFNAMVV